MVISRNHDPFVNLFEALTQGDKFINLPGHFMGAAPYEGPSVLDNTPWDVLTPEERQGCRD